MQSPVPLYTTLPPCCLWRHTGCRPMADCTDADVEALRAFCAENQQ